MGNTTIDINETTLKKYVQCKRPEDLEIRKQLDFGYSFDGKTALLYEIRPFWDDPTEIHHIEYAKIGFDKSKRKWQLYWMRGSGKWELYEPFPESTNLEEILKIITKDAYGCFHG